MIILDILTLGCLASACGFAPGMRTIDMTSLGAAVDLATVQALSDRVAVTDTLYRYASTIDRGDFAGTRSVLADDLWAQYGNGEPMTGGQAVADWIAESCATRVWQHHMLNIYELDIDGDRASALVYHTSHQVLDADPGTVRVLVGRYHDELKRTADGWRISKLVFEVLWGERRQDATGFLAELGGRGPVVTGYRGRR
jgi:ketosteroid isomerase-like protein